MRMMVISLVPASGVKCQVGEFSVLVDTPPSRKGSVVLRTQAKQPFSVFGEGGVIEGAGEYELDGVRIRGTALQKEATQESIHTAYMVHLDGIQLGFLGRIGAPPSDDELDALGEVDILFLSADFKKRGEKELVALVKQISPSIIIPTDEETAKRLSLAMGQKVQPVEKLVVKKNELASQEIANKLVWLKK